MKGIPLTLDTYDAPEVLTNTHFREFEMPEFEKLFLPESMRPFAEGLHTVGTREFIEDDNRGAVAPSPCLSLDGTDFYLSVKGVGSTTNPFSHQPLGKAEICALLKDPGLRERVASSDGRSPRYITGEVWLRGSPYGGQGLEHATTALKVSEMADLTSIHGFRVAPLVKVVFVPESLEREIKEIFWYRRFGGRMVQETRLVPSNVRVYFHSGSTIGGSVGSVFDLFGIDDDEKALGFLRNFLRSGIAFLTLFSRSMKPNGDGTFSGLDFYDVWLDKDAVVAPDGTIYFVDLEGLEWVTVRGEQVPEKLEDQIYRSLYEFVFAYEQVARERSARFHGGAVVDRKVQFEHLLREALREDDVVELEREGARLKLVVGNVLGERRLALKFPLLDW